MWQTYFFSTGPSILFTIGGINAGQNWQTVQTIDLSGQDRNCFQPKEFPWQLEDGQGFTGEPLVGLPLVNLNQHQARAEDGAEGNKHWG